MVCVCRGAHICEHHIGAKTFPTFTETFQPFSAPSALFTSGIGSTVCARWMTTAAKSLCSAAKPWLHPLALTSKWSSTLSDTQRHMGIQSKEGLAVFHQGRWPGVYLHMKAPLRTSLREPGKHTVSRCKWGDMNGSYCDWVLRATARSPLGRPLQTIPLQKKRDRGWSNRNMMTF